MTLPNLPEVPPNPSTEQLAQIAGELVQQLSYLLSGFLSSANAREFGGWQVGNTELQAKTKTVGMSTAVTAGDDIRFWAGDVKTGAPKFKVTEAGLLTAIGALIQSSSGYPQVVLNGISSLIGAYQDANNHLDIVPTASTAPGLVWTVAGSTAAYLQAASFGVLLAAFGATGDITLQPGRDINLTLSGSKNLNINGSVGQTASISYVKNVVAGTPSFGSLNFTKGVLTSWT